MPSSPTARRTGFNALWVNLLCATYTGGRPDGSTYDGIVPFTTPDDLSTPNESYFTRVDHMLRLAAKHGIVVVLDPAETGSYLSVLLSNGVAKSRDYGRFLGARYRSFDNIIWMSGNDFQSWRIPRTTRSCGGRAGIKETDDRHIHTVELDYLVSGSLDDPELGADHRAQRLLHLLSDLCPGADGLRPAGLRRRPSWSRQTTSSSTTPLTREHRRSCVDRSTGPC
jgi:hypothetical protein